MIAQVPLGERRDYEKRLSRAVAATSLDAIAWQTVTAHARSIQFVAVRRACGVDRGRVDDRAHLMVVPAIGVVVQNYDGGGFPKSRPHDRVDRSDQKALLQQGIGISSVAVLGGDRLEEADARHVADLQRVEAEVPIARD